METIYVRTLKNGKLKFYSKSTDELASPPFQRDGRWFISKTIGQDREAIPVELEAISWREILNMRQEMEYRIRLGIAGDAVVESR